MSDSGRSSIVCKWCGPTPGRNSPATATLPASRATLATRMPISLRSSRRGPLSSIPNSSALYLSMALIRSPLGPLVAWGHLQGCGPGFVEPRTFFQGMGAAWGIFDSCPSDRVVVRISGGLLYSLSVDRPSTSCLSSTYPTLSRHWVVRASICSGLGPPSGTAASVWEV
eukprot:9472700-Pyramimonas_sp.AAC.2